jgi:hypothetical protein
LEANLWPILWLARIDAFCPFRLSLTLQGLIYENSVMLTIYAPFIKATAEAMNNISQSYVKQFRQDSVLLSIAPATLGTRRKASGSLQHYNLLFQDCLCLNSFISHFVA